MWVSVIADTITSVTGITTIEAIKATTLRSFGGYCAPVAVLQVAGSMLVLHTLMF